MNRDLDSPLLDRNFISYMLRRDILKNTLKISPTKVAEAISNMTPEASRLVDMMAQENQERVNAAIEAMAQAILTSGIDPLKLEIVTVSDTGQGMVTYFHEIGTPYPHEDEASRYRHSAGKWQKIYAPNEINDPRGRRNWAEHTGAWEEMQRRSAQNLTGQEDESDIVGPRTKAMFDEFHRRIEEEKDNETTDD